MNDKPIQLFIASYDNEFGATQSLKDFQAMEREGSIDLIDAAVIVHTAEGEVNFEETADPSGKKWAKRGAIAGGLVGLIFPPSIIVGAAVGGGAGGIWGKVRDKGFKDEDLKEIGESMEPGSSAIIAIAEDQVLDQLERGIAGYDRIARHSLARPPSARRPCSRSPPRGSRPTSRQTPSPSRPRDRSPTRQRAWEPTKRALESQSRGPRAAGRDASGLTALSPPADERGEPGDHTD